MGLLMSGRTVILVSLPPSPLGSPELSRHTFVRKMTPILFLNAPIRLSSPICTSNRPLEPFNSLLRVLKAHQPTLT